MKPLSEQMQKVADRYEKATGKRFSDIGSNTLSINRDELKFRLMQAADLLDLYWKVFIPSAKNACEDIAYTQSYSALIGLLGDLGMEVLRYDDDHLVRCMNVQAMGSYSVEEEMEWDQYTPLLLTGNATEK